MQPCARSLLRACRGAWISGAAVAGASSSLPAAAAGFSSSSAGAAAADTGAGELQWVFLGPPGVGKGTYASRVAAALNVAHIAAGDLVRAEIKSGSLLGQQVRRSGACACQLQQQCSRARMPAQRSPAADWLAGACCPLLPHRCSRSSTRGSCCQMRSSSG